MRDNIVLPIALFCAMFMISCKNDIEHLPDTIMRGTVMEGNLKTPISGAKVFVWENRTTGDYIKSHTYRYKVVDSALTDASGKYALKFKTSRFADSYEPGFQLSDGYYFKYPSEELQKSKENLVNLSAYKAVFLKARIVCFDNTYPPMTVQTSSQVNSSWRLSLFQFKNSSIDTTVMLKLIPNKNNDLWFSYYIGNTPYFYSGVINPPLLPDTLMKTFTLNLKDFHR